MIEFLLVVLLEFPDFPVPDMFLRRTRNELECERYAAEKTTELIELNKGRAIRVTSSCHPVAGKKEG